MDHKVTHFLTDRINRRLEPTPQRGDRTCDCWVKDEPEAGRFELRNGAHNPTCPVYRVSLDPVDALKDADIRRRYDPEDTQLDLVPIQVPKPTFEHRPEVRYHVTEKLGDHYCIDCQQTRPCDGSCTPESWVRDIRCIACWNKSQGIEREDHKPA
jgi:hypothetical protein